MKQIFCLFTSNNRIRSDEKFCCYQKNFAAKWPLALHLKNKSNLRIFCSSIKFLFTASITSMTFIVNYCSSGCIPGCTCKTGFFLHNGQCITETDCEIELANTPCLLADKNSTYSDSIRCQPSCRDPSPAECDNRATDPMQGCMCKSGYIFNGTNCILPVDCTIKASILIYSCEAVS